MNTISHDPETLREEVRRRYGSIAMGETTLTSSSESGDPCCQSTDRGNKPGASGCCGSGAQASTLGYSRNDLDGIPDGANLGLGCGNPVALASLQPGQTVLDLGAGAGFDAFIAARTVGPTGRVIGVDMTPEMVSKARANAKKGGYATVEFRLGEIEILPVAETSVDVVISNCVINLCPDKGPVYREAFRVLRPGGRLAVSDVVAREELSDDVKHDLALHSGCLAGATLQTELVKILEETGFTDIVIRAKGNSDEVITSWKSKRGFESKVFAAEVTATKPASACCAPTCCQKQFPIVPTVPQLRPMTAADLPQARQLWAETEGVELAEGDSMKELTRYLQRNPGMSFVAVVGERLVGAVLAGYDGRRGLLYHLAVALEQRRAGTGRALVEHSLVALRNAGAVRMLILVSRDNPDGGKFWREQGWGTLTFAQPMGLDL